MVQSYLLCRLKKKSVITPELPGLAQSLRYSLVSACFENVYCLLDWHFISRKWP